MMRAAGLAIRRLEPRIVRRLTTPSSTITICQPFVEVKSTTISSYNLPASPVPRQSLCHYSTTTFQLFAKKDKKTPDATTGESGTKLPIGYNAMKAAAKNHRREVYHRRQDRLRSLAHRRKSGPEVYEKSRLFKSFFIAEKVNHEYMNRKARQMGLEFEIRVAVLLERINVVLPDLEPWEEEFMILQDELRQYGKIYPKEIVKEMRVDHPVRQEELLALLPEDFVPAPRETEADATGDVRTTKRKLKTNIFLAVQHRGTTNWEFPTVTLRDSETLLDGGKRALLDTVGEEVEYWCPSNCPVAIQMTRFTPDEQKSRGLFGTKTFYMKFQYDEGNVNVKKDTVDDFAWLDRDEFIEITKSNQFHPDEKHRFYHYIL